MGYSEAQWTALAILPKITAVPSIVCSSLIVYSVLRDPRKRAKVYHRLLLGISMVDISNSFWFGMSTWPIPPETAGNANFALGTPATCTMQGFVIQAGISCAFYNASLAVYYTLVLRFGWTEARIRNSVEPFLHAIPLIWGFGTATISIPLQLFNNANLWCWISPFPAGCEGEDCIRGRNADYYRWAFYYGPLWCNILCVTVAMFLVFRHVRNASKEQEKEQLDAEEFSNTSSGQDGNGDRTNDMNTDDDDDDDSYKLQSLLSQDRETVEEANAAGRKSHTRKVQRDIAFQCFAYSGTFYVSWVWLTTVRAMQAANRPLPFALIAVAAFMTPFQGLPNIFVYLFPKFLSVRAANPQGNVVRWILDSL